MTQPTLTLPTPRPRYTFGDLPGPKRRTYPPDMFAEWADRYEKDWREREERVLLKEDEA